MSTLESKDGSVVPISAPLDKAAEGVPIKGEVDFNVALACTQWATVNTERPEVIAALTPCIQKLFEGTKLEDWRFKPTNREPNPSPLDLREFSHEWRDRSGNADVVDIGRITQDGVDYYCYIPRPGGGVLRVCYHEVDLIAKTESFPTYHRLSSGIEAHLRVLVRYQVDSDITF